MKRSAKSSIEKALKEYILDLEKDLQELWNNLKIDLSQKEQYEVVGGLLARQITLTAQFASSSSIWTGDIAPVILRSLAENYINLAWILESPLERSRKFILHGLGQEKLMTEQRKRQLVEQGSDPEEDEMVKFSEKWINTQRFTFLTEVNLGSWSGISTRKMAQQANCMDFYNFVYLPFTIASHNMWNHIARYNLKTSDNVLHKLIRKPFVSKIKPHFDYFELAAKYTDKCFWHYYQKFPADYETKSSYQSLLQKLAKIEADYRKA